MLQRRATAREHHAVLANHDDHVHDNDHDDYNDHYNYDDYYYDDYYYDTVARTYVENVLVSLFQLHETQ